MENGRTQCKHGPTRVNKFSAGRRGDAWNIFDRSWGHFGTMFGLFRGSKFSRQITTDHLLNIFPSRRVSTPDIISAAPGRVPKFQEFGGSGTCKFLTICIASSDLPRFTGCRCFLSKDLGSDDA